MNPGPSRTSAGGPSRSGRRVRWVIPLVMLLAVPPAVLAAHNFTDVPNSHPFHTEISNLVGSGVTIGCGGGNYCPDDETQRDEMAAFLNRGLGRATAAAGSTSWALAATNYVASASITSGGAAGSAGVGFVLVTGSVTAYTETALTCPCEVAVWVDRGGTNPVQASPTMYFNIADTAQPTPTGAQTGSASVSWVFQVPSSSRETFNLGVDIVTTTTGVPVGTVDGALTLAYFPFGGTGSSTLSP